MNEKALYKLDTVLGESFKTFMTSLTQETKSRQDASDTQVGTLSMNNMRLDKSPC